MSIPPAFTVGTETSSFVDENQNLYTSGALSFGFGLAGVPFEIHAEVAKADVKYINVYEVVIDVCDWLLPEEQ